MKSVFRLLFILMAFQASPVLLFSQCHNAFYLGYNSSGYFGSVENDVESLRISGVSLGFCSEIVRKSMFRLETGIGLSSRGNKLRSVGDAYIRNIFLYLELPVIAKLHLAKDARIKPFVFVGPSLNTKLLCFNSSGFIDDIRSIDLALTFGTGVNLRGFFLRFRYTCGLIDFDISDYNNTIRNSTITVELGFEFGRNERN